MNCAEVDKSEWIEQYLTGALKETDRGRLEEHLLTCETCQEQLEELLLLRTSLGEERWEVAEEPRGSRLHWHWSWAAAAAAILVLAVTLWPRLADHPGQGEIEIARLSAVEAPPYEPRTLRSVAGEGELQFREAMMAYQKGSYAEAIPGLEAAVEIDPDLAKAHFYLGACYLLEDRPDRAIDSLSRVAETDDPMYREWAHFYRAKAYLRGGDIEPARKDLSDVISMEGELQSQAQEVLEQLSD